MNTGTLSRPSSPALAHSSSTGSSIASPTNTTARHAGGDRLAAGVRQHLADLGVAAAAVDLAHQPRQFVAVRDPAAGAAFVQAAIIHQADIEAADRRRLAEHVGLQRAGHVPGRLPAHGRVEREHQPAACRRSRRGAIARALATKAAISSDADGFGAQRRSAASAGGRAGDLVGSRDIGARWLQRGLCGARPAAGQSAPQRQWRPCRSCLAMRDRAGTWSPPCALRVAPAPTALSSSRNLSSRPCDRLP